MRRTFKPPRWTRRLRLGAGDRSVLWRIVGVGIGAFLLGYVLTALLFFGGSSRPEVVTVPDLREMTQREATRVLERLGLELVVGDTLPHPEVNAGAVLTQTPLPGREVAPGSEVRVIVSTGRPTRIVPDVAALGREHAERALAAAGFQVLVSEAPGPRAAGQVLSIEPAPGTPVRLPAAVRLTVSLGPPLVAVPGVVGLSVEEADAALAAAGLRLGDVEYELVAPALPEVVLEQQPLAGDSLHMGGRVHLRAGRHQLPGDSSS